MATFGKNVEQWRKLVDDTKAKGFGVNFPTDFLLAWIEVESGGNLHDVEKTEERGLFQVHPDESRERLRLTPEEHKRIAEDGAWSVLQGLRLADSYLISAYDFLSPLGVAWTGSNLWMFAKLLHALPGAAKELMTKVVHKLGRAPYSWKEFETVSRDIVSHGETTNSTQQYAGRILATTDKLYQLSTGQIPSGAGNGSGRFL